jgi:L-alanine-DL-glutamate epimerase-like enolase superfamily enzyme
MRITDVEAIVLRRHEPARDIADGTQDALVVRITTDDGLVGIGEVDSSPEVVKAAIEAPKSHLTSCGLRQLLLGEDPCDVARLWEKCYRGSLYFGRRGAGIHALSGIDIALLCSSSSACGTRLWPTTSSSRASGSTGTARSPFPRRRALGITLNEDVVERYRVA